MQNILKISFLIHFVKEAFFWMIHLIFRYAWHSQNYLLHISNAKSYDKRKQVTSDSNWINQIPNEFQIKYIRMRRWLNQWIWIVQQQFGKLFQIKVNLSRYIPLSVSTQADFFSVDCVNIYFSQSIVNYLFSIFFNRFISVGLLTLLI